MRIVTARILGLIGLLLLVYSSPFVGSGAWSGDAAHDAARRAHFSNSEAFIMSSAFLAGFGLIFYALYLFAVDRSKNK